MAAMMAAAAASAPADARRQRADLLAKLVLFLSTTGALLPSLHLTAGIIVIKRMD